MNDINILFVDDEKLTLNSLDRLLRKQSYRKFFAENGEEALQIIEDEDIHIIVSDMKMPQMDGLTLLRSIKEKRPEIVRLVLSAFTQTAQLLPCINSGEIYRFITKPLDKEELKSSINDAIEYYFVQLEKSELVETLKSNKEKLHNALQQQKSLENQLRILCAVDELTDLYSRRQLNEALESEIKRCERYSKGLSGIMLGLDQFKIVNDTHGKDFGDFVLRECAARIKASIRTVDIAFRFEKDVFFILLPETGSSQSLGVCQRIIKTCQESTYDYEGISHYQTVSFGITSLETGRSITSEKFLGQAEVQIREARNL